MSEQAIMEGAFQLYWRFIREPDQARARARFAKLKPASLRAWMDDAKAVLRIAEVYGS